MTVNGQLEQATPWIGYASDGIFSDARAAGTGIDDRGRSADRTRLHR